jgi:hypothetical protein
MWDCVNDLITNITASTVIALLALLMTLITTYYSRQHNKLSVKPLLCDGSNINSEAFTFNYFIHNKGLGTAKVIRFQYLWNGECISATNLKKLISAKITEWDSLSIVNIGESFAIAKDESIKLIVIELGKAFSKSDNPEERLHDILSWLINSCRIKIEIESMYGKKDSFTTSMSSIDLNDFERIT